MFFFFFFSSRRRHTRCSRDWSSDVCSSDLFNHGLFHLAFLAQRNPTSSPRCAGSAYIRFVAVIRSAGSYHPPPRMTLWVPSPGPFGLRTSSRRKLSACQSFTHSQTLPERS